MSTQIFISLFNGLHEEKKIAVSPSETLIDYGIKTFE